MNKPTRPQLTKICSSCGLPKTLSAFLERSGTGGTTYGNICFSCRKSNKDKPKVQLVDEGSSTSSTGHKIDAKAKVKSDIDKHEFREQLKELNEEEREHLNKLKDKLLDKRQVIAKKEKAHREGYLKKRSFLDNKKPAGITAAEKQFQIQEKSKTEIDYSKPVIDTQISGKLKHHSSIYNAFKSWLGTGAPIVSNAKKLSAGLSTPEKPQGPGSKKGR